jgi:hypothetical protein
MTDKESEKKATDPTWKVEIKKKGMFWFIAIPQESIEVSGLVSTTPYRIRIFCIFRRPTASSCIARCIARHRAGSRVCRLV